nr:XRE family transcriptional regulator [Leptospirillum ferriphilum]
MESNYLRISSRLSQREAAKKPGIPQPRLNDRLQGKLQTFSLVARVKMISKVGIHVDVHVIVA